MKNSGRVCPSLSGPRIAFVTLRSPSGPPQADLKLVLPFQPRFILCVNCDNTHWNNTLYMHFAALGLTPGGAGFTLAGNEPVFPFCGVPSAPISKVGMGYLFAKGQELPLTLFFDVGHESGAGDVIQTFLISDDEIRPYLIHQ